MHFQSKKCVLKIHIPNFETLLPKKTLLSQYGDKHCDLMFKKKKKLKYKMEENCHFILWQPSIKSSIMQRDNRKLVQCVSVIGCQSP